ncbi:hypothetical protein SNEBB_001665 [Seison nebaliae]|nr:hypothetical protein SNEBB_001665 [Seison nebaliae]
MLISNYKNRSRFGTQSPMKARSTSRDNNFQNAFLAVLYPDGSTSKHCPKNNESFQDILERPMTIRSLDINRCDIVRMVSKEKSEIVPFSFRASLCQGESIIIHNRSDGHRMEKSSGKRCRLCNKKRRGATLFTSGHMMRCSICHLYAHDDCPYNTYPCVTPRTMSIPMKTTKPNLISSMVTNVITQPQQMPIISTTHSQTSMTTIMRTTSSEAVIPSPNLNRSNNSPSNRPDHPKKSHKHSRSRMNDNALDDIEITDEKIGSGSYGTVYKGKSILFGTVAIKQLNVKNPSVKQRKAFNNEVAMLRKTRHDNVLFYIRCIEDQTLGIVTEWCRGNTLYHHLYFSQKTNWQIEKLLDISYQISIGMGYLHAKNIIHRDLKSKNIFLVSGEHTPSKWCVKIGDFGLATIKNGWKDKEKTKNGNGRQRNRVKPPCQPPGTVHWMSPEVIRGRGDDPYSTKSDVYSYGVVLYELMTGELPYADYEANQIIFKVGSNQLRPDVSRVRPETPRFIIDIMHSCYKAEENERLTFEEINLIFDKELASNTTSIEEAL